MIVSIAVVGMALMFATGQTYITVEGDNRVALFLAQQKIEQLRALSYTGLNTDSSLPGTGSEDPVSSYSGYSRTWSVVCVAQDNYNSTVACSTASSGKKISVTVQSSPYDANSMTKATKVTLYSVLASR